MNTTTVAYIAGAGRSGSTALSTLLAQMGSYAFVGEPVYLWEHGVVEDRRCGCDRAFRQCRFWRKVLESLHEGSLDDLAREMVDAHYAHARTRHLVRLAVAGVRNKQMQWQGEYIRRLGALYQAMARQVGARTIVDSSKYPSYALLLSQVPSIDLRVLHLVRDPRAVAYSWRRRKYHPATGGQMDRMSRIKSSLLWVTWNAAAELLLSRAVGRERYLRVRYEDITADPVATVRRIDEFFGHRHSADEIRSRINGIPEPSHSIGGNPMQFDRKPLRFRRDDEWVERMPMAERWLVTTLTWPLLVRYGYPIVT